VAAKVLGAGPTELPLDRSTCHPDQELAEDLGAVGYPGSEYMTSDLKRDRLSSSWMRSTGLI
jgi:hypothetical protein